MQKYSFIFKKYLFWWVIGLFIFIPLYPKFPFINVPGTYVAIRLEDILIAVTFVWWVLSIGNEFKDLFKKTITQTFLLFWGVTLLSLFSGIFLTQTVVPHLGLLHYLRRVEVMVLFFIAASAITSFKQIKIWLLTMLVVTILAVLYGFGQQYLSFPVISTTNREFSKGLILTLTPDARVNSTFAGHYDFAAYLAVTLTILSSVLLFYKRIVIRLLIALTSLFSLIILSLTAARISFAACVIGITSVFIISGHKKLILLLAGLVLFAFIVSPDLRHRTVATITVNILGGGGPKYILTPEQLEAERATSSAEQKFSAEQFSSQSATLSSVPRDISPGEPVNSTELGVYRSFGIRLNEEWPRAIRAFLKNPFLGTGYSSLTIATDNDYLRALGETGILGFLALFLILLFILKHFWLFIKKKSKDKGLDFYLLVGIFGSALTILINATFIDILESSKIAQLFWLTLGLGYGITNLREGTKP